MVYRIKIISRIYNILRNLRNVRLPDAEFMLEMPKTCFGCISSYNILRNLRNVRLPDAEFMLGMPKTRFGCISSYTLLSGVYLGGKNEYAKQDHSGSRTSATH